MAGINKQIDLCINCLNVKDCFHYKKKKQPIYFCEEFTCEDPEASAKERKRTSKAESMYLPVPNLAMFNDCGKP